MNKIKLISFITTIVILLVTCHVGCGPSEKEEGNLTGLFNLGLTDAPMNGVKKVVIRFTGVEIQPSSGKRITIDFDQPKQIDLLTLTGGESELLLAEYALPAGHYQWIRLMVEAKDDTDDSYLELEDGSLRDLTIPSGSQAGLKLIRGFEVPLGGISDFTIDFDVRKSVHQPSGQGGDFMLRPTLRMVDNAEVGGLQGVIDSVLIEDPNNLDCAVYIFAGSSITPDDIDENESEPLTTALVRHNQETDTYSYRARFLPAGDYTVALTQGASNDDPALDNQLDFTNIGEVTISANTMNQHDFQ